MKQLKNVIIINKEGRDKVNGNSYFATKIICNFGYANSKIIKLPMQYGYNNHFMHAASDEIEKHFFTVLEFMQQEIIFNILKYEYMEVVHIPNCKKSEVQKWGE